MIRAEPENFTVGEFIAAGSVAYNKHTWKVSKKLTDGMKDMKH